MLSCLGDLTASNVDDAHLDLVVALTGLTMQTVRRRIREAHGNTLVRNVFWRDWPNNVDHLRGYTIALARDTGLAPEIASATGLSERTVIKRLATERGNMLVANAFAELEIDDEAGEQYDDEAGEDQDESRERDETEDGGEEDAKDATTHVASPEVDLLGAAHVVSARSKPMTAWLAAQLGWPQRKMAVLLRKTHGRTLLRNALSDEWPIENAAGSRAMLGEMRVAAVRRSASLVAWVARVLDGSTSEIAREIRAADGNMLVKNLYSQWPVTGGPAPPRARPEPDRGPPPPPATSNRGDVGASRGHSGDVRPGSLVQNRWQIVRPIGERGGFGTVFEVRDETRPDRDGFVMKIAGGATDADRRVNEKRLLSEVRIAHGLTHQNICAYLDDGLDRARGVYFAIMKYAGPSLERLIRDDTSFDVADAFDVVQQVAAGLDYAHQHNVIHQDLKPANVLVQGDPHGREVRIGDWGISNHGRETQRADGSPTVIATVVGNSPGYMAPEQWRGEARAASDQYCLALLLCSMLEGRVFAEHYKFQDLRPLTADQNQIIERALSVEPEERFASCGKFISKLRGDDGGQH